MTAELPANVARFPERRAQLGERTPVVSLDTEQAVLGAVLVNPEAYPLVSAIARCEHFYEDLHRVIWQIVEDIAAAGRTPTYKAVLAAFGGHNAAKDLGGTT